MMRCGVGLDGTIVHGHHAQRKQDFNRRGWTLLHSRVRLRLRD